MQKNSGKVVLNIPDQFNSNNNCGFNLTNFRPHFIKDYFMEVVTDYERSFIGSFVKNVFEPKSDSEIYFSICKFKG